MKLNIPPMQMSMIAANATSAMYVLIALSGGMAISGAGRRVPYSNLLSSTVWRMRLSRPSVSASRALARKTSCAAFAENGATGVDCGKVSRVAINWRLVQRVFSIEGLHGTCQLTAMIAGMLQARSFTP